MQHSLKDTFLDALHDFMLAASLNSIKKRNKRQNVIGMTSKGTCLYPSPKFNIWRNGGNCLNHIYCLSMGHIACSISKIENE